MSKKEKTAIVIAHASKQPYLSIGVYYGGITLNKIPYVYLNQHDAFIQKSYLKEYKAFIGKNKKTWDEFLLHIAEVYSNQI